MECATLEADLPVRARQGDLDAFRELVRLFEGRVRSFFALRLAEPSQVDDLAQEVFFTAYRRLASFDPSMPFYPWLKGIALNVLRNELRKRRPDAAEGLEQLASVGAESLEDHDALEALRRCLDQLEGASERLVRARYAQELPMDAIGRQEGKSRKAVSVALVRIRRQLRECIGKRLAGGEA